MSMIVLMVLPVKSLAIAIQKGVLITCDSNKQNIEFCFDTTIVTGGAPNILYFDTPGTTCSKNGNDIVNGKIPCDGINYTSQASNIYYAVATGNAACPIIKSNVFKMFLDIFFNWEQNGAPIITPDLVADICVLAMKSNPTGPVLHTFDDKKNAICNWLGGINKCQKVLAALNEAIDTLIATFDPNMDYNTLHESVLKFLYILIKEFVHVPNATGGRICEFWVNINGKNLKICEFSDAIYALICEVLKKLTPGQVQGNGLAKFAIGEIEWIRNCTRLILLPMQPDERYVQSSQAFFCARQLFACSTLLDQMLNDMSKNVNLVKVQPFVNMLVGIAGLFGKISSLEQQFSKAISSFFGNISTQLAKDLLGIVHKMPPVDLLLSNIVQLEKSAQQYPQLLPVISLARQLCAYYRSTEQLLVALSQNQSPALTTILQPISRSISLYNSTSDVNYTQSLDYEEDFEPQSHGLGMKFRSGVKIASSSKKRFNKKGGKNFKAGKKRNRGGAKKSKKKKSGSLKNSKKKSKKRSKVRRINDKNYFRLTPNRAKSKRRRRSKIEKKIRNKNSRAGSSLAIKKD
jgi:hypothetical protein